MDFVTHTGLTLRWADRQVVLIGDRTKVIYPLEGEEFNVGKAAAVFATIRKHYEQREVEEKAN